MVNCTNTVLVTPHFVQFLFIGQTKSACTLCGKLYICVDGKYKLTSSSLKIHLDERHFSRTGNTVTFRRARVYPDTVEKSFILAKVIELFGFVLYPDMDFSECIPNKLFLNREAGIPFLAFSERMFRKCKTFQLSAAPNPEI